MIPGGHPLTPRKVKWARQRAASVGFASPCSPACTWAGILGRGLARRRGAGWGPDCSPPPSLLAAEELKTQPL